MNKDDLIQEFRHDLGDVMLGRAGKLTAAELVKREIARLDRYAFSIVEQSVPIREPDIDELGNPHGMGWNAAR